MAELAEVKQAEPRKKPATWPGIQLFQLKGNPDWERLITGGSLERIAKKSEAFIKTIRRIEERTGEKVLDTEIVQSRITELREAMLASAAKEGIVAAEVLQTFEVFMVNAKALEFFEEAAINLDDPSSVTDVRELQRVVREVEKAERRKAEGEDHADDKSEEFPIGILSFAVSEQGDGTTMRIYHDLEEAKRPKVELSEEKDIILYPEDPVPAKPKLIRKQERRTDDDKRFLAEFRQEVDEQNKLFRPEDRLKGWGTTNPKRSMQAMVGLVSEVQPLQIEPLEPILIIPDQTEERQAS